jgi:hypothetical protein
MSCSTPHCRTTWGIGAGLSPELLDWLTTSLLPRLGAYPHAKLTRLGRRTPQRNRHRKYVCRGCAQIIRAATSDLDVVCRPCNTPFELAD